jgi:hypothetical protein
MKPASGDRRPIHHSPIFWIGVVLCLAAIAIYLWPTIFRGGHGRYGLFISALIVA